MKHWRSFELVLASAAVAAAQSMPADYDAVLKALGKQGDYKNNVLKVNIPRNDLRSRLMALQHLRRSALAVGSR